MPIDRLPPKYRAPAERLATFLSTDAGVMIILGFTLMYRGASYLVLNDLVLINPLDIIPPKWLSSGYWVLLGAALLISSRWQNSFAGRCILALGVMTISLWGSLFLFATEGAFSQRGVIYIGFAAVIVWAVWRGHRGEVRVRREVSDVIFPSG